jgi:hypothetical protein
MVAQIDIKALTYITTQCSRQAVLSLICSLLNTVSQTFAILSQRLVLTHTAGPQIQPCILASPA